MGVPLRMMLEELGHKQPLTLVQTDNTTACDIVSNTVKQKRTHTMDMYFIGQEKGRNKDNLLFIGSLVKMIMEIIAQNST